MIAKDEELSAEALEALQNLDPIKCLWLLINTVSETGSISLNQAHLDALPDPPPLEIRRDKEAGMWHFKIPGKKVKKRRRGIVTPSKKIIVPGGN